MKEDRCQLCEKRMEELTGTVKNQGDRISTLEDQDRTSTEKISELSTQIAVFANEVSHMSRNFDNTHKSIKEMSEAFVQSNKNVEKLTETVTMLQKKLGVGQLIAALAFGYFLSNFGEGMKILAPLVMSFIK